jgi:hypothetical protein
LCWLHNAASCDVYHVAALHRQLILEDGVLLVCPHCWTPEQIAKEYPGLLQYPLSNKICNFHFEIMLAAALDVGIISSNPRQRPAKEMF